MLHCNSCGLDKQADEFYKAIQTRCRACVREYQREYSARPEVAARRRTNEYKDYHARYRSEFADRKKESQFKYQSKPEVKAHRAERERARQVKLVSNLPPDAYSFIISTYGACLKCNSADKLQVDHVVPLARGGEHTLRNLQVLCQTCNISKGARSSADYRSFVVIATPYEFGVN